MAIPQPGIFAQGTRSHYLCEFDLHDGVAPDAVMGALQGLRQPSVTAGGTNIVVAFGPDLWRRLRPAGTPAALGPFPDDLPGAPATPHDLLVWVHGTGPDLLLDVARTIDTMLAFAPALEDLEDALG